MGSNPVGITNKKSPLTGPFLLVMRSHLIKQAEATAPRGEIR